MSEGEILALKEALYNQYVIIKKLYMELEEEREASSTAANEALSMILRLQREKAAEKMEACQYKRMTEEKMHHAEECVVLLEEASVQKEIEISILKNQLQAYKHKLLSLGIRSFEFADTMQSENSLSCGDPALNGASSLPTSVWRNTSLPSLAFSEISTEIDTSCETSPVSSSLESIWKIIGGHREKYKDNYNEIPRSTNRTFITHHYSEDFKGKVKHKPTSGPTSFPLSPILSAETSYLSTLDVPESELESRNVSCLNSQAEELVNEVFSTDLSVAGDQMETESRTSRTPFNHDIFEVPESDMCRTKKTKAVTVMEDIVPPEAYKYLFGDDEKFSKGTIHKEQEMNISTETKKVSIHQALDYSCTAENATKGTGNDNSEPLNDFQIIKGRLKQLEDEKMGKLDGSGDPTEQLHLLKEIYDQLHTIQDQLKKNKSKEHLPQKESSFVSVIEAVLTFSI